MEEISKREAEVLELLGAHLTNAQIAARLFISVRTVESHVSALLRKLGEPDRQALANRAVPGATESGVGPGLRGAPQPFTTFVGRQRDIAEIGEALAGGRLVTLLGPGGIGKTRLALEVGARHSAADAWFVDLVPAAPGHIDATVAAAIGVAEQRDRSLLDSVCDVLATSHGLVVLDNCEHVLDEAATVVDRLLRTSPDLTVLATSRESLGLMGERVMPIEPLELVGPDPSATRLFRERAGAAGAALTEADDDLVGSICTRLDGIPLAIELAAARCASLGVDGVAAAIDDRLRLLVGARGADARHRSLRDVLDWSHGLLDGEERAVLRRASVFHGPFRAAEAEAVVGFGFGPGVVPDALGRLASKSLLAGRRDDRGLLYRLLDTVRAYANEQLDTSGERSATQDAHLAWSADAGTTLAARIAAEREVPGDVDRLIDDLRAALEWGTGRDDRPTTARLARAAGNLTYARFFFVEARHHFERAAELTDDPAAGCLDLVNAAHAAFTLLLGDAGYRLLREAAERALGAGHDDLAAGALALAIERSGRFPAEFEELPAHSDATELLAEAHRLGDGADPTLDALLAVADAWSSTDELTITTRASSERALDLARVCGDPLVESSALDALASALTDEGFQAEAVGINVGRLGLLPRFSPFLPSHAVEQLDTLHMATDSPLAFGDLPHALANAEDALSHPLAAVVTHMIQREYVLALCLVGRFDEAIDHAEIMRTGWERVGRPVAGWMAPAAYLTALAHALAGQPDTAAEWTEIGHEAGQVYDSVFRSVAEMRAALHQGRPLDALAELARRVKAADGALVPVPAGVALAQYEGYLWPLAAEAWVMSGVPDAAERLAQVRRLVGDHRWADPCLLRAEGRLTGDADLFRRSVAGFDAIEARYEAASTRALLPGAEGAAGLASLAAMGCTPPG